MGCATSVTSYSKEPTTQETNCNDVWSTTAGHVALSDRHKKVVVKNWQHLSSDLSGRGSRIFLLIFSRNPLIKSIFSFGHLDGDDMVNDPRFKGHALRFMQAVGAVVDNIDNYNEALGPLLNDLGRRHAHFRGFKPIYFNDFQDSIMQVFAEDLGSHFNSFARDAWNLVLLFILTELKRGFTQCLRERGSLRHADASGSCSSSQANVSLCIFDTSDKHSATIGSAHDVSNDVIDDMITPSQPRN